MVIRGLSLKPCPEAHVPLRKSKSSRTGREAQTMSAKVRSFPEPDLEPTALHIHTRFSPKSGEAAGLENTSWHGLSVSGPFGYAPRAAHATHTHDSPGRLVQGSERLACKDWRAVQAASRLVRRVRLGPWSRETHASIRQASGADADRPSRTQYDDCFPTRYMCAHSLATAPAARCKVGAEQDERGKRTIY